MQLVSNDQMSSWNGRMHFGAEHRDNSFERTTWRIVMKVWDG
jgi:hypothetical protein